MKRLPKASKQLGVVKALELVLNPKSVAVVGASRDEKSVGFGILKSIAQGCWFPSNYCSPFLGKVFPVNPKADEILGLKCFASVKDIPGKVDLAVIAVPSQIVSKIVEECGEKGVRAAVIVSAGFGETGALGRKLEEHLLEACRKAGVRMVGPNCLGVVRSSHNLNASFALSVPPAGGVGFISQSGALADSAIDWAIQERYAFSVLASVGNSSDLDSADFAEWMAQDKETKVITLYIEGLKNGGGRKFMEVVKRVSRKKPVLVLKAGKTSAGASAAGSHTGSLAGDYRVFKGAMRQCGAVMVESFEELFDLAKTLAEQPKARQNAVAIVTNSGGPGVLSADYCEEFGVNLVPLKPETLEKLEASGKMHPAYSRRNPLDLVGDALPERYKIALDTLLSEDYIHGLIVIQCITTMTDSLEDARIVLEARRKFPEKPIVCVFMGGKYTAEGVKLLLKHGVPEFNDPRKAAQAMAALCGAL